MFNKLKQFKDLRSKAKTLQNKLSDVKVEGSAAWGKIKMSMDGNQTVLSVSVAQDLLGDKTKLEEAIKEVANDTIKKAQRAMAEQMRKDGSFNIPGLG